jgi:hypothetical protein
MIRFLPVYFVFCAVPSSSNVEKITKEMAAEDERIENMVGNYLEQLRKKSVS